MGVLLLPGLRGRMVCAAESFGVNVPRLSLGRLPRGGAMSREIEVRAVYRLDARNVESHPLPAPAGLGVPEAFGVYETRYAGGPQYHVKDFPTLADAQAFADECSA